MVRPPLPPASSSPFLHALTAPHLDKYAEIDFPSARKTLYAPAVQMASRAGSELQCIRWIGEEACLVRGGAGGARWRWSDEVPPVARSGLRFGSRAGGVDENMPPAPVQVGEEGDDGEEREEEEEEESKPRVKARKQLFAVGAAAAAAMGAGGKGKGKGKARMMDWEDDDEEEGDEVEQDSGFFEGEAAR